MYRAVRLLQARNCIVQCTPRANSLAIKYHRPAAAILQDAVWVFRCMYGASGTNTLFTRSFVERINSLSSDTTPACHYIE
jgi:hypothetical protein